MTKKKKVIAEGSMVCDRIIREAGVVNFTSTTGGSITMRFSPMAKADVFTVGKTYPIEILSALNFGK